MRSGVPWQVQVRPEARETAREAARRSGMSVSEWLDSLIIDSAFSDPLHAWGALATAFAWTVTLSGAVLFLL